MTREEENLAIATWLGFRFALTDDYAQWHHPLCPCTACTPEDECTCREGCFWGNDDGSAPDFRTSEEGCAVILEKFFKSGFMLEVWPYPNGKFIAVFTKMHALPREDYGRGRVCADRKSAIVEAALEAALKLIAAGEESHE